MTTPAGDDDSNEAVKETQVHGFLGGWKSLFSFTRSTHLPILLPATLASAAAGGLQPAMALFFGKFFNTFSDFASGNTDGATFMNKSLGTVYALFAIAAATFVLRGTLFSLWLVFGEMQARRVRELLFTSLLERDIEWYEARTTGVGTLLTRLQSQIRNLQLGTSQPLGLTITCVFQALAGLTVALRTNWKLALVVLSAMPVIAIGATLISRGLQVIIDRQAEELSISTKIASNCIKNIVTVKCFNTQAQEAAYYTDAIGRASVFALRQAYRSALQMGFTRFAITAMFVQGFWYGGIQVHSGHTTAGDVVTTFWACLIATKALEDILPHSVVIQKSQASATALEAVIDKVSRGSLQLRKVDGLSPQFCEGKVDMREISFAYPFTPDKIALHNCNFHFAAGETTFIVGKSGSGKSTLSNLLMRFYRPRGGSIAIDDNSIQEIDTHWLSNNITLVQQNCILFSDTIFRNVALGRRDHEQVTNAQMEKCVHTAALASTIACLPAGLQTRVGTGGSSLSGGQKQRIALARARLRDTPILILDEATSALDNTSKVLVMESIREWRRGKTTIIITHDLSQIQDEEFMYVLDAGRIIQEGRRRTLTYTGDSAPENTIGTDRVDDKRPVGPGNTINRPPSPNSPDPAQALSSHPFRRDSFDFLTAEHPDQTTTGYAISSQGRSRLKKGVSISSIAAIKLLKRQSMARAKIIYGLQQDQMHGKKTTARVPARRAPIDIAAAHRKSVFSPRMLLTPMLRNKPLPVPLPQYEELRQDQNLEIATDDSCVGQAKARANSPSSVPKVLRTLWPNLDRVNRRKLVLGFLATLGHAVAPPAFSYALVQIFNTYYIPTDYQHKALMWSLVVIGIAVGDGAACFFMEHLLDTSSQVWVDTLRTQAFQHILRQPKGWFDEEQNSPDVLVSSLDKNAEEVKDLVKRFAAQLLVVFAMMLLAIIWALGNCWKITLVSLAASPVLYALAKCFEVVSARWESKTNAAGDAIGDVFVESFSDIRTVRSLTLESYFHMKYHDATGRTFSVGLRRALYTGFFFGLSESAIAVFTPMILLYGAYLAKDGEWDATAIFTVFGLLLFCTANANAIIALIPQTSSAADTASRLIGLSRMPITSHEELGKLILDRNDPATLSGPIHFINMTFYYPTRPELPALRRLNLTIPAGQTTAIVGASGSGKSTITALLLGLYPPTADNHSSMSTFDDQPPSLTLSGRDIRSLDLASLRSLVVMVPQSPVLLPATVRENITYGVPPNSQLASASNIESAAQAAGIHDFITSLPQGYATIIGDGGLGVSGGQAQRIVIARALIRDPKVLILDEATSALDYESAEVIRQSILRLIKGNGKKGKVLTVIVVTHAREMMEWADNVVVMEEGAVVEQGEFEALMGMQGRGKLWGMLNTGSGRILQEMDEDG